MIRIGPAGLGSVKEAEKTLEEYHSLGFRACEIAFVHSVYIKSEEDAKRIGKKAKELGIKLSIHAPYYVNLNAEEKIKREATKQRIMECCRIGELLGARTVVFHPGYYGKKPREEAYGNVKKEVEEMVKEIKKKGWKIEIAPETMGKVNVFGSLEEIAPLKQETESSCCIDFAHILARYKKVDYELVKRLFPQKEWHVHFSGIVYGDKGEKHHKSTTKDEWTELLENLPKDKEITIINESPTMIEDCVEGLKIAKKLGWKVD